MFAQLLSALLCIYSFRNVFSQQLHTHIHSHALMRTHTHTQIPKGLIGVLDYDYNFHTGLFTENSFVLAEGWYEDNIFNVEAFGFPPAEPSKITRYINHDTDSGIIVNLERKN